MINRKKQTEKMSLKAKIQKIKQDDRVKVYNKIKDYILSQVKSDTCLEEVTIQFTDYLPNKNNEGYSYYLHYIEEELEEDGLETSVDEYGHLTIRF